MKSNYMQALPGGHCFRCHKDYKDENITEHLNHCPMRDSMPTPCLCVTKYKVKGL